jgi:hypothetical protein
MFRGEVVLDTLTRCPAVVPTGPIRLEIFTFVLIFGKRRVHLTKEAEGCGDLA